MTHISIRISIRQRADGQGYCYYAGLACYGLPYLSDYQGNYPTRKLARQAAQAEAREIVTHVTASRF